MPRPASRPIKLSKKQEVLLQRLCRRESSSQQQVRRASIILKIAEGLSNKEVAEQLGLNRITVRLWRERWLGSTSRLAELELEESEKLVLTAIETVLSDSYRTGTPARFTSEQVVQIIALACELPSDSGLPLSHWTSKTLAVEAVKRGLVESISEQSVERFLKGSRVEATSISLLANERTRQRP
jgi:putative transposase